MIINYKIGNEKISSTQVTSVLNFRTEVKLGRVKTDLYTLEEEARPL